MNARDEWFVRVDEEGRVIGRALRSVCHSDPSLLHAVVHVFVFNGQGDLFLQKRSMQKDTQPGMWDLSVGGHLSPGETPEQGAMREMREELGVVPPGLEFLYKYVWRCPRESEYVWTFEVRHDGPFECSPDEIDEGRFWSPGEIEASLGLRCFTPNFEAEWERYRERSKA